MDLQKIMYNLTTTTEVRFINKINSWHNKYKDILYEKSINEATSILSYKHPRIISAYKNLLRNLPYLFTYKKYPEFNIHNTTNAIDGGVFSPMKKLMNIHNGFSKSLKIKIVDFYLVNYGK